MCPSHITYKWAREVLLTIPRAHTFLIEDMRNGGDPSRPHGIREVKRSKGKTVYEGRRLIESDLSSKKRKRSALWPTADETNVQLSLFD
jgi:hypothetical protein